MQMRITKNQIDGLLKKLTQGDFDTLAEQGRTILIEGTLDDGYIPPKLADGIGWKLQLSVVFGGKDKSHKRLVLLPADLRARRIWMKGQVTLAKRAGLSDLLAKAWAASTLKRRHELLDNLVAVMKDPKAVQAYLAWDKQTVPQEWVENFGIKDGLHPGARNCLAEQVAAMVEVERQWNDPVEIAKREQQKAAREAQNSQLVVDPALAKLLSRVTEEEEVVAAEAVATPEPDVGGVAADEAVVAEGSVESVGEDTISPEDETPVSEPVAEKDSAAGVDVTVADEFS